MRPQKVEGGNWGHSIVLAYVRLCLQPPLPRTVKNEQTKFSIANNSQQQLLPLRYDSELSYK